MRDDIELEYPDSSQFDTREQALADALAQSEPGDQVIAHQDGCAVELGQCTCTPDVLIVPERAS